MPTRGRPLLLLACVFCLVPVVMFGSLFIYPCGYPRGDEERVFDQVCLRDAVSCLSSHPNDRWPRPRCVADLMYIGAVSLHYLRYRSDLDYTRFRFGTYSLHDLDPDRMTHEELDAEVSRLYPVLPAWDALGPLTMCFDPRVFDQKPNYWVILGTLKNYPGRERGDRELWVVFADGGMLAARALPRLQSHVDVVTKSLAFYGSIGIPMPEGMVAELREAMGVRDE